MARVKDVMQIMQKIAPREHYFSEEYDNIGLIVGDENAEVKKVLCCLDVTNDVLNEAIKIGADMIVSHHPMIFAPIKNVTTQTVTGSKVYTAIKNGIHVFAAHTNLDFVRDGINDFLAAELGLLNVKVLYPYISEVEGFGRVGTLTSKQYCTVLKSELEVVLKDKYIRIVGEPFNEVLNGAIINGAGGGDTKYIDMAIEAGADCLVTADVKHHVAVYAKDRGLTLIEPQHFTMEYAYITRLVQILKIEAKARKLDFEILQAANEVNPRF